MNWFVDTIQTSIGKKLLMALTGLGFVLFLAIHLIGNLTLYAGKDTFLSYVAHLHALDPIIRVAEIGLLLFALIHVATGLTLVWRNWKSRPVRYQVKKNAGGRTIGSMTMPYTGLLILGFVAVHLGDFHFIDHDRQDAVFQAMTNAFASAPHAVFYTLAVLAAALHVSHGFWSLFQTLGANHPNYMPAIRGLGLAFSLLAAVGFGFIPLSVYMGFIK